MTFIKRLNLYDYAILLGACLAIGSNMSGLSSNWCSKLLDLFMVFAFGVNFGMRVVEFTRTKHYGHN